jgi:ferredoxin
VKIVVDRTKCQGVGICETFSPDIFEVDADGELVLHVDQVPATAEDHVRHAIDSCPTEALRLKG